MPPSPSGDLLRCPKCGHEQARTDDRSREECLRCGVIFRRVRRLPEVWDGAAPEAPDAATVLPPSPTGPPTAQTRLASPPSAPAAIHGLPDPGGEAAEAPPAGLYGDLPELYPEAPPPPPAGAAPPPRSAVPASLPPLAKGTLDRPALRALAWGAGLALLIAAVPLPRFVFSYLGILIHELGHTAASWIFGVPAVPSFDFVRGGGVSVDLGRSTVVTGLLVLGLGWLGWHFFRQRDEVSPFFLGAFSALVALWALVTFTPAYRAVVLAAGHGAEALFAGIFLYRAATGSAVRFPSVERPLYAAAGLFLWLEGLRLTFGLMTDEAARRDYEAMRGAGMMDFSRLAAGAFDTSLATVAGLFFLLFLVVPVLTFAAVRYREHLVEGAAGLLGR